jgi:RNA polymerase sigma-70 factor (ECF subfamily)
MATPVAALEDYSLVSITADGAQVVAQEATPERLQEFDNIVSRGLPRFRRIAMRWLGNHEDAEDAVQDAMLSAFTHIADFEGRAQMSTWLTTVVINAIRMQIRRRRRGHLLSLDCSPKEDQSTTFAELLLDPRPTPEQTLEQRQFRQIITKLTNGLPPHQRAALLLRQQDCFSLKETAEILGVPLGTVKAQLARGRAKIIERFHKVTGTPKIEASGSGPKTRRKASFSGCRRNRTQDTAYSQFPAVLNQQRGSEVRVSA